MDQLASITDEIFLSNSSSSSSHDYEMIASDGLAAAYGVLAVVALVRCIYLIMGVWHRFPIALGVVKDIASHVCMHVYVQVQIIRIQIRVPEYGWTTQKVFHLLNFLVAFLRALVFACLPEIKHQSPLLKAVFLDFPGLLFFSTYTLLVLFWAEIYYQALSRPTDTLKKTFIGINVLVYSIETSLWMYSYSADTARMVAGRQYSGIFLALVSFLAAIAFLLYGGRLFFMLQRFPIDSRGRRSKLQEVGLVTSICAACFFFRSCMVAWSTFDQAHAGLDVLGHPLLNVLYYSGAEIAPSALVLYILRKLPPSQSSSADAEGYEALP